MADGKLRETWRQQSYVMAAIYNALGGRDGRPISPDQLNPYLAARRPPPPKMTDPRLLARDMGGELCVVE
jgi:hypothetical protein